MHVIVITFSNSEIAQLKEEHIKRIVELHTNNEEAQKTITTIKRDIEVRGTSSLVQKRSPFAFC